MLTLKYFSLKARGEVPRLILKAGGVSFNNVTYDFVARPPNHPKIAEKVAQYKEMPADFTGRQWLEDKSKYPFSALPVLENVAEIDGAPFPQSRAIVRYCARLAKLEGSDEATRIRADIMAESAYEWFEKVWMKYTILVGMDKMSMKSEDKLQRWESLKGMMEGECEDFLDSLEKLHVAHLGENSPFFAGKELTYADLQLLVTFDLMKDLSFEGLIAQNAPNLARIAESVADLPELREYVKENENVAVVAAGMLF